MRYYVFDLEWQNSLFLSQSIFWAKIVVILTSCLFCVTLIPRTSYFLHVLGQVLLDLLLPPFLPFILLPSTPSTPLCLFCLTSSLLFLSPIPPLYYCLSMCLFYHSCSFFYFIFSLVYSPSLFSTCSSPYFFNVIIFFPIIQPLPFSSSSILSQTPSCHSQSPLFLLSIPNSLSRQVTNLLHSTVVGLPVVPRHRPLHPKQVST